MKKWRKILLSVLACICASAMTLTASACDMSALMGGLGSSQGSGDTSSDESLGGNSSDHSGESEDTGSDSNLGDNSSESDGVGSDESGSDDSEDVGGDTSSDDSSNDSSDDNTGESSDSSSDDSSEEVHTHSYETTVINPTCTEQGYTQHSCGCGYSYQEDYKDELGHSYAAQINGWAWNGYESATLAFVCANDETHTFSQTAVITSETTTQPSCALEGERIYTATVTFDGETYTDSQTETLAASHNYEDGVCSDCGDEYVTPGLSYTRVSGTPYTYTVKGLLANCTDEIIYIPSTYNGYAVTAIGEGAFKEKSHIKGVRIPDSVTSIGKQAFYKTSLEKITISENVQEIGEAAFSTCASLTEVSIAEGITTIGKSAFYKCTALTEIALPNSLTTIGNRLFYGCSVLEKVEWSDDITEILEYTFVDCAALKHFTLPANLQKIERNAFSGCKEIESIVIPDSVTEIGASAFEKCNTLEEVVIGDGLIEIKNSTFDACKALKKVTVGTGLKTIGSAFRDTVLTEWHVEDVFAWAQVDCASGIWAPHYILTKNGGNIYCNGELITEIIDENNALEKVGSYAFKGMTSLTKVVLGSNVTAIGAGAFQECTALTDITFGDNIQTIGESAFEKCKELTRLVMPNELTRVETGAFSDCSKLESIQFGPKIEFLRLDSIDLDNFKKIEISNLNGWIALDAASMPRYDLYVNGALLTELTIPKDITQGVAAFKNCKSLTKVTFEDGVTTVGEAMFGSCSGLTEIVLPDSVTEVKRDAFNYCSNVTKLSLSKNLKTIGEDAFSYLGKITEIVIPDSVETIGDYAFRWNQELKSIVLGKGVTEIGLGAFHVCSKVENVYYAGTVADWNKVSYTANDGFFTDTATWTMYYYSATQPTDTKNSYWHYVDGVPTIW